MNVNSIDVTTIQVIGIEQKNFFFSTNINSNNTTFKLNSVNMPNNFRNSIKNKNYQILE